LPDHDIILAVLQSGIGLAGLLLIFSGFLFTKAASFDSSRRGDKYRWLALATIAPIFMAILVSLMSMEALEGNQWSLTHLLLALKITLVLTEIFAIIAIVASV
jgi:hypothetical protein